MANLSSENAMSSDERRTLIRQLLKGLPNNFDKQIDFAQQIRSEFQEELAKSLQAGFAQYVSSQPRETFVDKGNLAKSINMMLRSVGLGVRDPKTGLVASIGAESRGAADEGCRFRLLISTIGGERSRSSLRDDEVLGLTLAPDDEWKRWYGTGPSRT